MVDEEGSGEGSARFKQLFEGGDTEWVLVTEGSMYEGGKRHKKVQPTSGKQDSDGDFDTIDKPKTKKKKKVVDDSDEEEVPKKKKKKAPVESESEEEAPKKKKKAEAADSEDDEPPKKKKKPKLVESESEEEVQPKKKKKAKVIESDSEDEKPRKKKKKAGKEEDSLKKRKGDDGEAYQAHDYTASNASGATFWMTLKDYSKYFYISTVSYSDKKHHMAFCQDQAFSYKWCACMVEIPETYVNCFVSLYQLNDRFINDGNTPEDYEYADMQLIVTKVLKQPARTGKNKSNFNKGECAFIDGTHCNLYNTIHTKINKMTAGSYIFFYTGNFREEQLCRKLNIVLHTPVENLKIKRISARKFGKSFLNLLERENFLRSVAGEEYHQPYY